MKPYRFDSGLGHSLRQFASTGADCLFFTATTNCAMRSLRVRHASPYNDTIKNMCVAHFCAILARAAFYGAKRICKMHIGNLGCAGNATTITQSRKCALRIFGRFSRGRRFTAQSEYVKYILGIWGVAGNALTMTQPRKRALHISVRSSRGRRFTAQI